MPTEVGQATTAVQVGFLLVANNAEGAENLGIGGINNGDEQAVTQALIDHVNATGGLAGHPIEPVYHLLRPTTTQSGDESAQAACATFTEDHAVTAAVLKAISEVFWDCISRAGVFGIASSTLQGGSSDQYASWPRFVVPNGMLLETQAQLLADALARQGFYESAEGVGLVVEDRPEFRAVAEAVLLPALRAVGGEPRRTVFSPRQASSADIATVNTAMSNAVLQFRTSGIDRVLFFVPQSGPALFFMQNAESQGYRPRYGAYTGITPQLLAGLVPPAQFEGAIGFGFDPALDAAYDGWRGEPPGRQRCLEVLAEAGMQFTPASNPEWTATLLCDAVFFLDAAGDSAGPSLTADSLLAGATSLADGFASASTRATRVASDRRAGGAAYQDLAFDSTCACFHYTSGPRSTPR